MMLAGLSPEALSVSPWSYAKHFPMLLANSRMELNDSSLALLKEYGFKKAVLLGDVSDQCAGGLEAVRLMGTDRYETSIKIAQYFVDQEGAGTYQNTAFAIGRERNYPDALASGMLQGKFSAPVILTQPGQESTASFCKEALADPEKYSTFYFLGAAAQGKEGSVYDEVVKALS